MNCVALTGTVLGTPDKIEARPCGHVCNFRLAIDTRSGKRPTEVTVCCWDDLARFFGQYLSEGDRVAVTGLLSHAAGKGVVVAASQLARLSEEPLSSGEQHGLDTAMPSEPDGSDLEKNWTEYLDLGAPGAQR